MGPTVRVRARSARFLGMTMITVAGVGLVSAAAGGLETALRLGPVLVLFGLLGWAAFWQPYVEISDGGVTVSNIVRTVHVPWPAVTDVEGRYGLRLATSYGPVTAWAAAAPAGRARARGENSPVAVAVADRLQSMRLAGHLDRAHLERDTLDVVWHLPVLVTGGVLVAGCALALAF